MLENSSNKLKIPTIIELLSTILLIVIVNLFSWANQPQISNNMGKGMDGVEYFKVAEDISHGNTPKAKAPFLYRIGTPALVATTFPNDLLFGFKVINIFAGSLIPIALLFWISIYFKGFYFRLLPVALFSLTWHSPLRMSWYYPVHSDPLSVLFLMILLIMLYHLFQSNNNKKAHHKIFVTFISFSIFAAFFREICIIPALLYFLANISLKFTDISFSDDDVRFIKSENNKSNEFMARMMLTIKKLYFKFFNKFPTISLSDQKSFIPLIFGVATLISIKLFTESTVSYSFSETAFSWLYRKSLMMYLHAWLIAFGPVLFVILINYKAAYQFLKSNMLSAYFLIIIAFMGVVGGSDTERILFWSMPVVYIMIVRIIIENREVYSRALVIFILTVSQIINMRVFWATPDYPNEFSSIDPILTPIGSSFPLLDLWTWHGDLRTNLISFAGYLCLFVFFLIVYKYYERKLS